MKRVGCNKGDLSPYERVTCEILENARRPLTTNEVAYYGNMSWLTAKKHLEVLSEKRIGISSRDKGRAKLWFIE
jgi:predicted transcriptional regulator